MRIVEIAALSNGAHRNAEGKFSIVPDGWAVIPESMNVENFPFGELVAQEVDGVMTVTFWKPGTMPEHKSKEEQSVTAIEQLRADVDYIAVMTGVEL